MSTISYILVFNFLTLNYQFFYVDLILPTVGFFFKFVTTVAEYACELNETYLYSFLSFIEHI